jgi:hypothetical protein
MASNAFLPIKKVHSLALKDLALICAKSVFGCCQFIVAMQLTNILAFKNGNIY